MNVENKLKEIFFNNTGVLMKEEQYEAEFNFEEIGITSLNYIKILVDIENEFNFEFEDELLDYEYFKNYKSVMDYIENRVGLENKE